MGANGVSFKFIKTVLPHILSVFTHLFNFSNTTSIFPSAWKIALVSPLPKCGSPTGFCDFRPIGLLSVLSKGIERLICDQFLDYLDSGGLLSPYQSGFPVVFILLWPKYPSGGGEVGIFDISSA
jgi:hypothetical protein